MHNDPSHPEPQIEVGDAAVPHCMNHRSEVWVELPLFRDGAGLGLHGLGTSGLQVW